MSVPGFAVQGRREKRPGRTLFLDDMLQVRATPNYTHSVLSLCCILLGMVIHSWLMPHYVPPAPP